MKEGKNRMKENIGGVIYRGTNYEVKRLGRAFPRFVSVTCSCPREQSDFQASLDDL